jgi:Protein of unknown function (DUF3618)
VTGDTTARASTGSRPGTADTGEIRSRIEQTRIDMSETIDAIQERLHPSHIVADTTQRLKNGTVDAVRRLAERGKNVVNDARNTSLDVDQVVRAVRENPIPVVAGFTAAALAVRALRHSDGGRRIMTTWLLVGACAGVAWWTAARADETRAYDDLIASSPD